MREDLRMKDDLLTEKRNIMRRNEQKIRKELKEWDDEMERLIRKAEEAKKNNKTYDLDSYIKTWQKLEEKLGEFSKEMGEGLSGIHPGDREALVNLRQKKLDDFWERFVKPSDKEGGFASEGINIPGALKTIKDREKESRKKDK
jgi:hypothetical protein